MSSDMHARYIDVLRTPVDICKILTQENYGTQGDERGIEKVVSKACLVLCICFVHWYRIEKGTLMTGRNANVANCQFFKN
jgi:hypothetical protein